MCKDEQPESARRTESVAHSDWTKLVRDLGGTVIPFGPG